MTFLFGPANLIVSSHMVDCINKFVACAQNHEYEPYSKPTTGIIYFHFFMLYFSIYTVEHRSGNCLYSGAVLLL